MQIPAFTIPSRPEEEAIFRMPTVDDAMAWAGASLDAEEANTTRYLREMLEDPNSHDPQTWTAQDRRTALWWIFTNSRLDPTITVQYECAHCGDTHFYDCDMSQLIEDLMVLTVEPFIAVDIPVNGITHEWIIKPLDGRAMEHLERARAALPPVDDPSYSREVLNLEMLEIAHQAHLVEQPADYMEAAEYRYSLIGKMALDTEFTVLAANVEIANRQLRHGLEIRIDKGEATVQLPQHPCPTIAKEKGEAEAPLTRLFTPFRARNFLPSIRPRGMGSAGQ
ncbi:TPA: morphogenetic protein [Enterobacter hormaechei subsp. xiangfangensis]|nr:morphogenetic protein [Enterobacter hormaechei subsp. xiangfangensis]